MAVHQGGCNNQAGYSRNSRLLRARRMRVTYFLVLVILAITLASTHPRLIPTLQDEEC
jgi:hypothetical protein